MDEILLCKCQSVIEAHNVISILKSDHIAFRQHDETSNPHSGLNGPTPGIAIYVSKKEYAKALTLIEPIVNASAESTKPFCPKCGCEDTVYIKNDRFITPLIILSIVFFIAPIVYLHFTKGLENKSVILDILAYVVFISSIVIFIFCDRKSANYKCNNCGKTFRHV